MTIENSTTFELKNRDYVVNHIIVKNICLALILLTTAMFFIPVYWTPNFIMLFVLFGFCIYTHVTTNRMLVFSKLSSELFIFLLFWLGYAMLGYFWAYDKISATNAVINIGQYSILFLVFSQLFLNKTRYKSLAVFFQVMFLVYIVIFVWEIFTAKHFPQSRLYGSNLPIPTGPFVNENNTSSLCLMILPFLSIQTGFRKNKLIKSLLLSAVFLFMIITLLQGARVTFLILLIYSLIYLLFKATFLTRFIAIMLLIVSSLFVVRTYPQELKLAGMFIKQQYKTVLTERSSVSITSLKIRSNLIKEGLDFTWRSGFLGIGGGNFEDRIKSGRYYNTGWVVNAHNFWIEILATYGLIIFLGIIYFYLRWLITLWKIKNRVSAHRSFYQACFISLLLFIPLSIIPSSIKTFYPAWFYLAFIHGICESARIDNLLPREDTISL